MARARIVRHVFQKIDPLNAHRQAREEQSRLKQLENQEKQRLEAEQRKKEKEEQRIAERKQLLDARIQEALEKGEITAEEAAWLPELNTDRVVTWVHSPYIDQMIKLRTMMDNNEWEEVCLYVSDKKDYNPEFTEYMMSLFGYNYSFEEYRPYDSPLRKWKRKTTETTYNGEPWTNNLYDACAPHLVVTHTTDEGSQKFGLMGIFRQRFTKHGLSMMARSQFIKVKLFEQETDIPVFMLMGIGGTASDPEQLFVVPFADIENHFIPKPIAYRYEMNPNYMLHYIPELRKLK